jgi:hypothetical protein
VPFLRLTRDRRGFENTFLMHADRPGDRPRLLYWYRTAPGIVQGRSALDEDAIRAIEEQHPDIDFDWPAILALSEVMTPEDEAPAQRQPQQQQQRREKRRGRSASARSNADELRRDDRSEEPRAAVDPAVEPVEPSSEPNPLEPLEPVEPMEPARSALVDELAGREIAGRLRARYEEITARIEALDVEGEAREAWFRRAEALDPDAWDSPESVLEGVRSADSLFETLKAELGHSSRE